MFPHVQVFILLHEMGFFFHPVRQWNVTINSKKKKKIETYVARGIRKLYVKALHFQLKHVMCGPSLNPKIKFIMYNYV